MAMASCWLSMTIKSIPIRCSSVHERPHSTRATVLQEPRAALEWATRGRRAGDITENDLPASHRHGITRRLTQTEWAERDAIQQALRVCKGNRVAAAARLGIGRTTLCHRIRRYRISR